MHLAFISVSVINISVLIMDVRHLYVKDIARRDDPASKRALYDICLATNDKASEHSGAFINYKVI